MKGLFGCIFFNREGDETFTYSYNERNSKFQNDKVILDNPDYTIMLDGCIVNLVPLKKEYRLEKTLDLLLTLWHKYSYSLVSIIKGSFVLVIKDKQRKVLFVTNDRLCKYPLYYYSSSQFFIFSSRFEDIVDYLKQKNCSITEDKLGITMMLKDGFIWEDRTYVNEVRCIRDYEVFIITEGIVEHKFISKPSFGMSNDSEEVALDKFYKLISSAVQLQYDKNKECEYAQVATISGGMDSRTALLLAVLEGYKDISCFCYSQSGSKDFEISKSISQHLKFDYFFYPLDSALFLVNPYDPINLNEGMQSYCGSTGAYTVFHKFLNESCGIIHSGLLGGEQLGDIFHNAEPSDIINPFLNLDISNEIIDEYNQYLNNYSCMEELELVKQTRGCKNLLRMADDKFIVLSPFIDEDVYEYLYALPLKIKYKRRFYSKWMNRYIPNSFPTTFFTGKIPSNILQMQILEYKRKILSHLSSIFLTHSRYDMNPFSYWLSENTWIRESVLNLKKETISKCNYLPTDILNSLNNADSFKSITAAIMLEKTFNKDKE